MNAIAGEVVAVLCGIGRNQAATAAPTATSVVRNMTNTSHRICLLNPIGEGGPHAGGSPGGIPAGPLADEGPKGGISDIPNDIAGQPWKYSVFEPMPPQIKARKLNCDIPNVETSGLTSEIVDDWVRNQHRGPRRNSLCPAMPNSTSSKTGDRAADGGESGDPKDVAAGLASSNSTAGGQQRDGGIPVHLGTPYLRPTTQLFHLQSA